MEAQILRCGWSWVLPVDEPLFVPECPLAIKCGWGQIRPGISEPIFSLQLEKLEEEEKPKLVLIKD